MKTVDFSGSSLFAFPFVLFVEPLSLNSRVITIKLVGV